MSLSNFVLSRVLATVFSLLVFSNSFAEPLHECIEHIEQVIEKVLPKSLQECPTGEEILERSYLEEHKFPEFIEKADSKVQGILVHEKIKQAFDLLLKSLPDMFKFLYENEGEIRECIADRDKWLRRICALESRDGLVCKKVQALLAPSIDQKFERSRYLFTIYSTDEHFALREIHQKYVLRMLYVLGNLFNEEFTFADVMIWETLMEKHLISELMAKTKDHKILSELAMVQKNYHLLRTSEIEELNLLLLSTEQIAPQSEVEEDVCAVMSSYLTDLFELGLESLFLIEPSPNFLSLLNMSDY